MIHTKVYKIRYLGCVLAIVMLTNTAIFSGIALAAANVTFSTDTDVIMTGPGINLTVQAGSVADTFTVNASTINLVIDAGDSVTLINPTKGQLNNNGGVINCHLVSNQNVVMFTGPLTVTVTPSAIVCSSGGGGGGGGGNTDHTPPANTSIVINGAALSTATTAVTLALAATDATQMLISNYSNFSDAIWENFTTAKSWTLLPGTGDKTVYIKFRDALDNTSGAASDTITLVSFPATEPPSAGYSCPALAAGDMVKVAGKPAIYALNNNLQTLYFPSGDEFKSWRPTYGGYISITQSCFDILTVPSAYPGAVNYRPGSYVVKRSSSDQLYVVEPHNTLAKITSAAAKALYGADYKVMAVADVFWPHYVNRGADISTATPHPGMLIKADEITYYVDAGNILREVTTAGMTANGFQTKFVHVLPGATIDGWVKGEKLETAEPNITNMAQQTYE